MNPVQVLLVNACPRGSASRSLYLSDCLLRFLRNEGEIRLRTHDLCRMELKPLDGPHLMEREALCNRHDFHGPLFAPARDLMECELLVIAAPYWDLSFPSVLKVWIEHMFVRNLTFVYRRNEPQGLCPVKHGVYLTTSGSPMNGMDFGFPYIREAMRFLGVPSMDVISAEGLDLEGARTEEILQRAVEESREWAIRYMKQRKSTPLD